MKSTTTEFENIIKHIKGLIEKIDQAAASTLDDEDKQALTDKIKETNEFIAGVSKQIKKNENLNQEEKEQLSTTVGLSALKLDGIEVKISQQIPTPKIEEKEEKGEKGEKKFAIGMRHQTDFLGRKTTQEEKKSTVSTNQKWTGATPTKK